MMVTKHAASVILFHDETLKLRVSVEFRLIPGEREVDLADAVEVDSFSLEVLELEEDYELPANFFQLIRQRLEEDEDVVRELAMQARIDLEDGNGR